MTTTCLALACLLLGAACGDNLSRLPPDELALRDKLGIPRDAARVIVFGQNAHLDIDWQHTFADYDAMFAENLLTQAQQLMAAQPRAFYSVAEMAYLQAHLAQHPEELAAWRAAASSGQLRIVGGGMTSPDTLLPETELLSRDFLFGVQFAEDTLGAHPTAAWLPDSFGHGAAAPDLLAAAGFTSVGFSRIDGAPTLSDYVLGKRSTPLPGSTAAELAQLGSADFVWRGSGGSTILAHYLAGTGLYCEGDNIDYQEPLETPGGHIGSFMGDDPTFTDASIDRYITEESPYARTPYMFVPVGCDFASPKVELIGYLDGYDQRHPSSSAVYAVAASFEDFEALVGYHAAALPTIDHELSPYYMGFYGTRADVKRRARDAARPFFVAETYATLLGAEGAAIMQAAAPELAMLTRADHHDFITGTSADAVVTTEQLPLLAETKATGTAALAQVASALAAKIPATPGAKSRVLAFNASSASQTAVAELDVATTGGAVPMVHAVAEGVALPLELIEPPSATTARFRVTLTVAPFGWQAIDVVPGGASAPATAVTLQLLDDNDAPATGASITRVVLANSHVTAHWQRTDGMFALASLVIDGREAIAAPSAVVHDYTDSGGLWRMGNEMPGCELTAKPRAAATDTVQIIDNGALTVRVAFVGADATREAALGADDDSLDLALVTGAAMATTRTAAFALVAPADATLATSVPGGWAARAAEHVYTPTFWPAVGWAQVGDWAVLLRQSTGARMDTPGHLELIAARDARQEACDVEGGSGSDPGVHRLEWRIAPASDATAAELAAQAFDRPLAIVAVTGAGTGIASRGSLVTITGGGVVTALKPADRGAGVILRVELLTGGATVQLSSWIAHATIIATDLVERDEGALPASDALGFEPGGGALRTVRLQ